MYDQTILLGDSLTGLLFIGAIITVTIYFWIKTL